MEIRQRPSPNHNARPDGQAVDILLLHYTGMESADAALERLVDPAAQVSAHYIIDEAGAVTQMVAEDRRAWHAGVASWSGDSDVNGRSIGIELVNPGHELGYRDFPEPQMTSLISLAKEILARHPIPPARVLGHSDVAPLRKLDPGERFDWARLAAIGIGLWPAFIGTRGDPDALEHDLARFGYGFLETDPSAVIAAFQRHYRPWSVTGRADPESAARLAALLDPPVS
ncbi:MAG: N-acetylmuramoyl-L-alanine amidase [Pseudomonadota bacterium]